MKKLMLFIILLLTACSSSDPASPRLEAIFVAFGDGDGDVGVVPLTLTLDASISTGAIVDYVWDFGDGATANGQIVEHTYREAGVYTITLSVVDDQGATDEFSLIFPLVEPEPDNVAPRAAFTALPVSGQVPLEVSFDASSSSDPDGTVTTFAWDLGDGTSAEGESVQHTYDSAGEYTAILTVTDDDGATDTSSVIITVEPEPVNRPPNGTLRGVPDMGNAPLQVTFTTEVTDEDGDPLNYTWDFGDGTQGDDADSQTHTYTEPGTYEVSVTISDGMDSVTATITIVVEEELPLPPPTITASSTNVVSPNRVTLSCGNEDDPNDLIENCVWDFGDGTGPTTRSFGSVSHMFVPGTFTVTLTVNYSNGTSAQTTTGITARRPADVNCSNFATQNDAQRFFNATSTVSSRDPYRLDGDSDGIACESL